MKIGVPREIKAHEYRVGLTPSSVREYVAHGHAIFVEAGAGSGIGACDSEYQRVGAAIVPSSEEVFALSEMIVKVKEPQPVEWQRLRENQIIFAFLHLAADMAQTRGLLKSGCAAIAYETVTDQHGGLPLLAPMSEVAGRLAVEVSALALRRHHGGRGVLVGGVPGVPPARIAILGGGVVGSQAARMASGLGTDIVIIERSLDRLRRLDDMFHGRVRTLFSSTQAIEQEIEYADVLIGAVLIPGASAPKLIRREHLGWMKRGAVIADVAIDQGGCFETSRPTTHEDPIYEVGGVVHYCVANMPGAVPTTSSYALNNATLPYGLALADHGLAALAGNTHLQSGLNVCQGKITHPAVAA